MKIEQICRSCQMHDHWRIDEMLASLASHQSLCEYSVVMPNLKLPVLSCDDKIVYQDKVYSASSSGARPRPWLLMTCQLTHNTPLRDIQESPLSGLFAWKGYSKGVTTNSEHGIEDWDSPDMHEKATVAGRVGIPILLHLQDNSENPLDGEVSALIRAMPLIEAHKDVLWSIEHATTAEMIAYVEDLQQSGYKIVCTLTLHHATKSCDDVIGNPLLKVQPPLQSVRNRDEVLDAILSGKHIKGRDAAAHPDKSQMSFDEAPSGIWTPDEVDIPLTYQVFREHGGRNWRYRLKRFISANAHQFYGFRMPYRNFLAPVMLVKEDWVVDVPTAPIKIIPFMFGETLHWRLID